MSFTIETLQLAALIGDLRHTTDPDPDTGVQNGILFHTARGYHVPGDPGLGDILVGTSTIRYAIGHAYVPCYGQITRPMIWPLKWALAVVNMFKPLAKDDQDHTLTISTDGMNVHVAVAEEPKLFEIGGEGDSLTFGMLPLDKWPRATWDMLRHADRPPADKVILPRYDLSAGLVEAFAKVARNHGGVMETYWYGQGRGMQVEIGDRYRGYLSPAAWPHEKNPQAGWAPGNEVHEPELPPVEERPEADPDSLLEQVAEMVINTQLAAVAPLTRKLKISVTKLGTLLEQLELLGVVGPIGNGNKPRDVLVPPSSLGVVLEKIRATRPVQTELGDDPGGADAPES